MNAPSISAHYFMNLKVAKIANKQKRVVNTSKNVPKALKTTKMMNLMNAPFLSAHYFMNVEVAKIANKQNKQQRQQRTLHKVAKTTKEIYDI